jgi:phosphoenolpyruvate-protein phosphotransferase (PTS system enzyme I)
MTLALTGIGISTNRTVAIGAVALLQRGPVRVNPRVVEHHQVNLEVHRLRTAVARAGRQLLETRERIPANTPQDIAEFIDAHLLMLEDRTLFDAVEELIRDDGFAAEWALQQRRDTLVQVFDAMGDPYLRTRRDDLDHVVTRVQKILLEQEEEAPADLQGRVILAVDLTPADTILMRERGVAGFVTEFGGPMSHTAILARSLGIPAVVGVRRATEYLRHGETVALDSSAGVVLAGCDSGLLEHFRSRLEAERDRATELLRLRHAPAVTTDGERCWLMANIELPEDLAAARENGAVGVGLYRTEFLYMNRESPPDEEEQFETYRAVIQALDGMPITIRTLDLGADKTVDGCQLDLPAACNPAMGLRAIRLCLKEPELFRPQLRAILRASAFGPVRLMLPMLTNIWEVLKAKALVEDCMHELRRDSVPFDESIPIGGMIEVPGAALAAESFARHLDFLSIGTNDLIQYTLAIDRIDDSVNYLYDPLHPAVLQLIQHTIVAANRTQIPIGMCGEMAGDRRYIPLLLGMGLREFSMQPGVLLAAKQIVRESRVGELKARVARLMECMDETEMGDLLQSLGAVG